MKVVKQYIKKTGVQKGPLFLNSTSKKPLNPATISKIIVELIDEADPGKFPRGHDVRRAATSLAWSRGLPMAEIMRRAFWADSNTFIQRYMSSFVGNGVALNTVG